MGVQFLTSIHIMKVLVVLALIGLTSVNAVSWSDCDGCKAGMSQFLGAAEGGDGIQNQVDLLKAQACIQLDDVEGCGKGVDSWWPQMSVALFGSAGAPEYFCVELGMCEAPKFFSRLDACQHCKDGMTAFFELFSTEKNINDAVMFLDGPEFCEQEGFDEATQAGCKTYVEAFVPIALPVLGSNASPHVEEICEQVFQLCP